MYIDIFEALNLSLSLLVFLPPRAPLPSSSTSSSILRHSRCSSAEASVILETAARTGPPYPFVVHINDASLVSLVSQFHSEYSRWVLMYVCVCVVGGGLRVRPDPFRRIDHLAVCARGLATCAQACE